MENNITASENPTFKRIWLAAALLLSAATAYVPMLLFILPAVWTYAALVNRGWLLAVFSVVLGITHYLIFASVWDALFTVVLIAPSGCILYALHRFKFENFYCVFVPAIALMLGQFVYLCVPALLNDLEPTYLLKEAMLRAGELMRANGFDPAVLNLGAIDEVYLSGMFVFGAVAALCNGLAIHFFDRKVRSGKLTPLPPFPFWTVPRSYVYGMLATIAVALLLMFSNSDPDGQFLGLAQMMWLLPMAFSGWCFTYTLCMFRRLIFLAVSVLLLFLFPMSLWFLAMLGSFCAIFMKRKREP